MSNKTMTEEQRQHEEKKKRIIARAIRTVVSLDPLLLAKTRKQFAIK